MSSPDERHCTFHPVSVEGGVCIERRQWHGISDTTTTDDYWNAERGEWIDDQSTATVYADAEEAARLVLAFIREAR